MRVSRIFWDTNLFIYRIEDFRGLCEQVINSRNRRVERGDKLHASALMVGEILIKPIKAGDEAVARRYESALLQGAVVIAFDLEPARLYASIRKGRTIRPLMRSSWLAHRMRASISLSLMMSGSARNQFLESSSSAR